MRQQKNPDRVSVYIDDEFAFGIPEAEAIARGLTPGYEVTEEDAAEFADVDETSRATDAAVQFIAYRVRSEREVRDRLTRRKYSDFAIERAIERVKEWGYLDDREFTRQWVANRTRHRPRGERLLRQELYSKGVDREIIDEILAESDVDEFAGALELARKRLSRLSDLDVATRNRRLSEYLARRGYNWETIRQVIRELKAEREGSEEK